MYSSYLFTIGFLLFSWISSIIASTVRHDNTFIPDAVLRVTVGKKSQSCLPTRETVLVNGTSPGPLLRLPEGNTYWIRVFNDMTEKNLTMHWHGLSMATSPFSDGTPSASQWPIPALHYFDYEIHVPKGMAGTYFYHSHVGFQAVTASGPLIVEDSGPPPYAYDDDKTVFIQDVFAKNDSAVEQGLVATPLSWSGEAASLLVNGQGGGSANGSFCNGSLSTIHVEPGKTYRLRFIGATALSFVSLAIEGHDVLTVVEADGAYSKPLNTTFLQVGTGQRYSVLLRTKSAPEKTSYYMQLETRDRPTLTRGFAILSYAPPPSTQSLNSPPTTLPLILPPTTHEFLDYSLSPLSPERHGQRFPTASEVTRTVTLTTHQSVLGRTVWVQNQYPWTEDFPPEPYLVSLYRNSSTNFPSMERALANSGIDPITRTFPAQIGEVIEIIIQNTGSDSGGLDTHPFHAHGAHYWDLGSGNGTYDAAANEAKWTALKGKASPMLRDTSMLHRYATKATNGTAMGWRAWRLRVDQPGVWMVHCHILQHMIMGMQTVWVMGNSSEVLKLGTVDVQGYLDFGGNVTGNENRWPDVVEYWDNWYQEQR